MDGTFTYAVLDINGDLEPELLLRAGANDPSPVRVLRAQGGTLKWTKDYPIDSDALSRQCSLTALSLAWTSTKLTDHAYT